MKSWYSIVAKSDTLAEISIYEEIGYFGVTAKTFLSDLKAVGNRKIVLRLNCPGGDVFEGMAIYNRLKEHAPGVEVRIDGLAASMASVIAMAGTTVKIAENALIMIHNPSTLAWGDADEMRDAAALLDKVRDSLITAYERKTGLSSAKIIALLDAETWMNATEARELRFVDEITEPLKMAARFDTSKFRNAPTPAMNPLRTSILALLSLTDPAEQPLSDEQISAALTEKFGTLTALTTERDDARAELVTIKAQFDAITTEANTAKADLVTAKASIVSLTDKLTATEGRLAKSDENTTRLEALCGVKGIPTNAAVPNLGEQSATPDAKRNELLTALNSATDPLARGLAATALRDFDAAARKK